MFFIYVDKSNLAKVDTPALMIKRVGAPDWQRLAKTIELPAGAVLRQAYAGERDNMVQPGIRAWLEAEVVVADGEELR